MTIYIGGKNNNLHLAEDTRLVTTISLKNSTYTLIENVLKSSKQSFKSRGNVVDAAVEYWVKHYFERSDDGGQ